MGKIAINKAKQPNLADRSDAIVNRQGGIGFEVTDPVTRLISAACYMGEPTWGLNETPEAVVDGVNLDSLDKNGRDIYRAAVEVATGDNPEDLLVIAHWARQSMNMRLFPQLLLVAAARHIRADNRQNPIIRYMPKVAHRPDDLIQVHAMWNAFFGTAGSKGYRRATLPMRLKKAMALTLRGYKLYSLVKWTKMSQRPNLGDVLGALRNSRIMPKGLRYRSEKHGGEAEAWPFSKAVRDFLINGTISDDLPPKLRARGMWGQMPSNAPIEAIREVGDEAGVTWEDILSKFSPSKNAKPLEPWQRNLRARFGGDSTDEDSTDVVERRRELWAYAMSKMPPLALLKNVRNLVQNRVPNLGQHLQNMADPDWIRRSRVLPFRFHSALMAVRNDHNLDATLRQTVENALSNAMDVAADNVAELPGVTAIFVDTSGSMTQRVSAKGTVTCVDIATLMAGILNRRCETAHIWSFGTKVEAVPATRNESVFSVMNKARQAGGGGTNFHLCFRALADSGVKPDRLIFLSDNECARIGHTWVRNASCADVAREYLKVMPESFVHGVDLAGVGHSALNTDMDRFNVIGGYSERVFSLIGEYETRHGQTRETPTDRKEAARQPTIEALRDEFRILEGDA